MEKLSFAEIKGCTFYTAISGGIRLEATHALWNVINSFRRTVSRTEHEMLTGLKIVSPPAEDSAARSQL